MKKTDSNQSENSPKSDSNLLPRSEGFHLYAGLIGKLALHIIAALGTAIMTTILTVPICVILIIWLTPGIMGPKIDKIDGDTLTMIVLVIAIWGIAYSVVKAVWEFRARDRVKQSRIEE